MTRKIRDDDWMAPFRAPGIFATKAKRKRGRPRKRRVPWPNEWQSKAYQMDALDTSIGIVRDDYGYAGTERGYIAFYLSRVKFATFGAELLESPRRVTRAEVATVQRRLSRWRARQKAK